MDIVKTNCNLENLTSKDDKYPCGIADKIILESRDTDQWYEYFDNFASLLNHQKSLIRNRVINITMEHIYHNQKRKDLSYKVKKHGETKYI